jgi:hypothetical protein
LVGAIWGPHACTTEAAARLNGSCAADPAARVAELETVLNKVRLSLTPLLHPLNPLRARGRRARQVLAALNTCAREVRGLAAIASDPVASSDHRLTLACERVERAVEALTSPEPRRITVQAGTPPLEEPVLAHLHGLERALAELAAPLLHPRASNPVRV